jgi:hypothetical protein
MRLLCDNQNRATLQTDQRFPSIDKNKKALKKNDFGSFDIHLAPKKAPDGHASN